MGSVTCLGLGLMGSAFARCFIRHGHDVTVWNRDPEKRKPFEGQAKPCGQPRRCGSRERDHHGPASPTTRRAIPSLHTDELAAAAKNTLLCQFTSGSAPDARAGQAWANAHGLGLPRLLRTGLSGGGRRGRGLVLLLRP